MMINEFLKLLPFEITAEEFTALIISLSIVMGVFETCQRQILRTKAFYKEKIALTNKHFCYII